MYNKFEKFEKHCLIRNPDPLYYNSGSGNRFEMAELWVSNKQTSLQFLCWGWGEGGGGRVLLPFCNGR